MCIRGIILWYTKFNIAEEDYGIVLCKTNEKIIKDWWNFFFLHLDRAIDCGGCQNKTRCAILLSCFEEDYGIVLCKTNEKIIKDWWNFFFLHLDRAIDCGGCQNKTRCAILLSCFEK